MGLAYRFRSVWTVYDRYEAVLGPGGEVTSLAPWISLEVNSPFLTDGKTFRVQGLLFLNTLTKKYTFLCCFWISLHRFLPSSYLRPRERVGSACEWEQFVKPARLFCCFLTGYTNSFIY